MLFVSWTAAYRAPPFIPTYRGDDLLKFRSARRTQLPDPSYKDDGVHLEMRGHHRHKGWSSESVSAIRLCCSGQKQLLDVWRAHRRIAQATSSGCQQGRPDSMLVCQIMPRPKFEARISMGRRPGTRAASMGSQLEASRAISVVVATRNIGSCPPNRIACARAAHHAHENGCLGSLLGVFSL